MNKVILVTGLIVSYGYMMEHFIAWYSGNEYEMWTFFVNRARGPYAGVYWLMIACNVITPNIFWFKKARTSIPIMWVASILVNIGHVVRALHHHRHLAAPRTSCPPRGACTSPTWVDWSHLHRHARPVLHALPPLPASSSPRWRWRR